MKKYEVEIEKLKSNNEKLKLHRQYDVKKLQDLESDFKKLQVHRQIIKIYTIIYNNIYDKVPR